MQPDRPDVREWLDKARADLRVVRRLLTPDCAEWGAVGFHCQQAIEKSLKAYLVAQNADFQRVHDLRYLLQACLTHEPRFTEFVGVVEPLTTFAVVFRYPGPPEPGPDEVRRAADVAQGVMQLIEVLLAPVAGP